MNLTRSSGILLHISSLPGSYGIGDLGPEAYRFVEFLARTGQRIWQVLPLVPVGHGYSPYSSPSTFAGNPLFISPDILLELGLLHPEDLHPKPNFSVNRIEYEQVISYKSALLRKVFDRFENTAPADVLSNFEVFAEQNIGWLDDYALFMALKEAYNNVTWTEWPRELVTRDPEALLKARSLYSRQIGMHKFWQFVFTQQWLALKDYCNERSIHIFGDLPIYVAHDSADVWANQELFFLDAHGNPTVVAGVPPDYFSATGQRWGNPIYRWNKMRENGYRWWTERLEKLFEYVDLLRLDHFRAFEAYWEIPATEETAVRGEWIEGPGAELFDVLRERLGTLPIVAEDLGIITPGVRKLMKQFDFPGMAVLQFAFDSDVDSDYLPHNFKRNLVAYTGTHDNDTTLGWWRNQNSTQDSTSRLKAQAFARQYVKMNGYQDQEIHWAFVRAIMSSVADLAIFPLQDILGLGSEGRMNTPGQQESNWAWRYRSGMITEPVEKYLRGLTEIYGRAEQRRLEHLKSLNSGE